MSADLPLDASDSSEYSESSSSIPYFPASSLMRLVCEGDLQGLESFLNTKPLAASSVGDITQGYSAIHVCLLLGRLRELACLLWAGSPHLSGLGPPLHTTPAAHLGLNVAGGSPLRRSIYLFLLLPELLRLHKVNPDNETLHPILSEAVAICLLASPTQHVAQFAIPSTFAAEEVELLQGNGQKAFDDIRQQWERVVDFWRSEPAIAPQWSFDLEEPDDRGCTLLTLACQVGASEILDVLIAAGARPDALDDSGLLPLDHATASGLPGPAMEPLLDFTARSDRLLVNQRAEKRRVFRMCIRHQSWSTLMWFISRLQTSGGLDDSDSDVLFALAEELGSVLMLHGLFGEQKTLPESYVSIYTSPVCNAHLGVEPNDLPPLSVLGSQLASQLPAVDVAALRMVNKSFPENPARMEVLLHPDIGVLRRSNIPIVEVDQPVSLVDVLRVHDWSYIRRLMQAAAASVSPSHEALTSTIVQLDSDTGVTRNSWEAASCAARAVIEAASAVCRGDTKRVFCAIRPPGHHVGVFGACQPTSRPGEVTDEDMAAGSLGFCLLNHVAIGASYVMANFPSISRIAIVDFDIHHGNGTEHIISRLGPRKRRVTAALTTGVDVAVSLDECRIWKHLEDSENIFFASLHVADESGAFYPGSGFASHDNIHNFPLRARTARSEMRQKVTEELVPRLLEFQPDILFLSAGFDGHYADIVHEGSGGYTLADLNWITEVLVGVANTCCDGRVVSVLEGGYNTRALGLSPFARAVAGHVNVLSRCPPEWKVDAMLKYYANEAKARAAEHRAVAAEAEAVTMDVEVSGVKRPADDSWDLPAAKRRRPLRSSAIKAMDDMRTEIEEVEEGLLSTDAVEAVEGDPLGEELHDSLADEAPESGDATTFEVEAQELHGGETADEEAEEADAEEAEVAEEADAAEADDVAEEAEVDELDFETEAAEMDNAIIEATEAEGADPSQVETAEAEEPEEVPQSEEAAEETKATEEAESVDEAKEAAVFDEAEVDLPAIDIEAERAAGSAEIVDPQDFDDCGLEDGELDPSPKRIVRRIAEEVTLLEDVYTDDDVLETTGGVLVDLTGAKG